MTEKDNYDDVKEYEFGNVALRLAAQRDLDGARGALEILADDFGAKSKYGPFFRFTLSSDEGVNFASSEYGKEFNKTLGKLKISELMSKRYDEILTEYLENDELEQVKGVLDDFKDETYGDITDKITQAVEKIKSQTGNFSDEDKREARKTLKKYEEIGEALELLEQGRYVRLMPYAIKKGLESKFKDYAKRLIEGED